MITLKNKNVVYIYGLRCGYGDYTNWDIVDGILYNPSGKEYTTEDMLSWGFWPMARTKKKK